MLAKSCNPVSIIVIIALLGKKYPLKNYLNAIAIVAGVDLFMGGSHYSRKIEDSTELNTSQKIASIILFFTVNFVLIIVYCDVHQSDFFHKEMSLMEWTVVSLVF